MANIFEFNGYKPVIHKTAFVHPNATVTGNVTIGKDVYIGHGAIIHGGTIGKNVLVGMNSVVMDNCEIGDECIIGALCFVPAETIIPKRKVVAGNPAKIVKVVSDEMIAWKTQGTALYQKLPQDCFDTLKECEPLRREPAFKPEQQDVYKTWGEKKKK